MVALAAVSSALAAAPALAGDDPQWAAKWVGQSGYPTLESGQVVQSQFRAQNIGSGTWTRGITHLGAVNFPYDSNGIPTNRNSAFYIPGDWLSSNRPDALDQASVPPGGQGTFTFNMRGPQVQQTQDFVEQFAPVEEGVHWLGCASCSWASVWLRYHVLPSQPPKVNITSAPRSVTKGDPIDVAADATDNVVVDHVVFSLDDKQITVASVPYRARFASDDLSPGGHVITAKAFDRAGNQASDVTSFSVTAPQGGGAQPPPPEPVPDVGVGINEGAPYTNDPLVRLTLHPPAGATGATISNDGLFNSSPVPVNGPEVVSWTLLQTGSERLPKTVYVHFTGPGVDASDEHTDTIILDQTPPTVGPVRVEPLRRGNRRAVAAKRGLVKDRCSAVRLTLKSKAHDNASHVHALFYRFKPHAKPTVVAYHSSVPLKLPPKLHSPRAIFVAVQDGALNLSKVRKVSLRSVCR